MIGETLLHYRIVEKLGAGGMGEVYRARDTKLNRDVALKVLSPEMAQDPDRRKRFEREAQAVAALKHPNIVTIYSVESADDTHFLTMELVEGQTLAQLIPEGGLSLDRFFELTIPLADAVSSAHASGITHRDLKPANVMLDSDGRVKVLDFGLAKLFEPVSSAEGATMVVDASATAEGKILGTAAYMSPEQAEGRPVDHRTDIFSLGIILYEMATGERPFKGDTSMSILGAIMKDTPSSVTEIKHQFPRALDRIITQCLAKDPDRRFQTMTDVRNQLDTCRTEVDSGELADRSSPSGSGKSVRWAVAIGALALLAAAIVFGPQLISREGGEGQTLMDLAEAKVGVIGFENLSDRGDPEHLGRMLAGLITTDLVEDRGIRVVTTPRILSALRKAGGDDSAGFDAAIAGDAARMAGADVMLVGQILQDGERVILTAELAYVEDGSTVGSLKKEADSKADLFSLAEGIAEEVRQTLGAGEGTAPAAMDLTEILTNSPQAYRHYALGETALHGSEWAEAAEHFGRAIREDPTFAMAYLRKAMAEWWGVTRAHAAKTLQEGAPHTTRLPERWQLLYRALSEFLVERYEAVYQILAELDGTPNATPDAFYLLGELFTHGSRFADFSLALDYFEKAIELEPTYTIALFHLIEFLSIAGEFERAERVLERCRAVAPDDLTLSAYELRVLVGKGEFETVITRGRELESVDHTGARQVVVVALVAQSRREEALDLAGKVAEDQMPQLFNLGNTQIAFGRIQDGLASIREISRVLCGAGESGNCADTHLQTANLLSLMGDYQGAIDVVEASLAVSPEHFAAYPSLAYAHHRLGRDLDVDETLARLEQMEAELGLPHGEYWVNLMRSRIHLWRNEITEAESALDKAVRLPPVHRHQPWTWFVRGQILDAKGDAKGAVAAYTEVWNTNTTTGQYLNYIIPVQSIYFRARAEERAGNLDEARRQYQRFLYHWGEADVPLAEVDEARFRLEALEEGL